MALIFNENVKFDKFLIRKQVESIQSFSNKYVHQRSCQPYKVFPTSKEYDLKPYLKEMPGSEKNNLFNILAKRRSGRAYSPYSISLNELALLCHYSYGISGEDFNKESEATFTISERFHLQVPYIHLNYTYIWIQVYCLKEFTIIAPISQFSNSSKKKIIWNI